MPSDRTHRAGHHRALIWKRLALAAASVALALLALEVLIAQRVLPLSGAAADYVHGCYEASLPDRFIHASLGALKVGIHRPNFAADCYSHGYAWRHHADGYGWRNPETWETADVVLLGDSMIYGHGVEEEQTTAAFLRGLLGRRVVNMGITGGSPVHYLAYVRNFALPLEPKVVVVFTFANDLWDIRDTRPLSKIRRFVRTGKGREAQVLPRSELLADLRSPRHPPSFLDRFAIHRWLEYHWKASRAKRSASNRERTSPGRPEKPRSSTEPAKAGGSLSTNPAPPPDAVLDKMERLFTLRYLRRAVAMMAESSQAVGASLVVGHIGQRTDIDWAIRRAMRQESTSLGFHYFDVPELVGNDYRLPHDGHYNELGHRRLAEALAEYLEAEGLLNARP